MAKEVGQVCGGEFTINIHSKGRHRNEAVFLFLIFNLIFAFKWTWKLPKFFLMVVVYSWGGDEFVIFPFSKCYKVKCLHSRD